MWIGVSQLSGWKLKRGRRTSASARVLVLGLALAVVCAQLSFGGRASEEDPEVIGRWGGPYPMPVVAVHAALLSTSDVLVYSSGSSMRILNWSEWTFRASSVGRNLFCTGHSFLSDGTLLVTGGHLPGNRGTRDAHLFDPFTETWTRLADMASGRWYPTNTTLPDGRVLVASGLDENGVINNIPEIYTPGAEPPWEQLAEPPFTFRLYPFMFLLPTGEVFYAGPGNPTRKFDVAAQSWSTVGTAPFQGDSAVLYESGKVMKSGGGDPAIARTAVIDMNAASPAWRETAPMEFPRRRHNLTVLPDGKVLVTGGTRVADELSESVYAAEMWDPASEAWTTMSSMTVARMYHSTALLLPDGRVLSAGGNGMLNAEIYSPPYLFAGPRPEISSAPANSAYGTAFEVTTPDASTIASVALIRPSAVTHAYNQEQRYLRLSFEAGQGVLDIQAPADPNLAPPGYYMLFLVNTAGVPSDARFIRLDLP